MPKLVNIDAKKLSKISTIDLKQFKRKNAINDNGEEIGILSEKENTFKKDEVKFTPQVDIDQVLNNFNWQASGDASILEKRLQDEIMALEVVCIKDLIFSQIFTGLLLVKMRPLGF